MRSVSDVACPQDPIRRIMATRVASVGPDESIDSVAKELSAGDIGAVVVSIPGGRTGVLSERDVVALVANGIDLDTAQAAEVMTGDLIVAGPEESIESVGRQMCDAAVRHVVVTEGSEVRGIVSIRDILAAYLERC